MSIVLTETENAILDTFLAAVAQNLMRDDRLPVWYALENVIKPEARMQVETALCKRLAQVNPGAFKEVIEAEVLS
jgi:hypothetical protein